MPAAIWSVSQRISPRLAGAGYTIVSVMLLCACGRERSADKVATSIKAVDDTGAVAIPAESTPAPAKAPRYVNAAIVSDTLVTEPQIESRDTTWTLRLPPNMVRVLEDSLPGLRAHELVIGDFNGDSKRDVAIDADAPKVSAFLILLSKSDSVPEPRLFLVWKAESRIADLYTFMRLVHPQEFPGDGEMTAPYTLRTDAVLYGYEMAASIYFIEKGELRSYSVAD